MGYDANRNFLQVSDWPAEKLETLLEVSARLKRELRETGRNAPVLAGKTLAMIFEKPSMRTRVSFAVGMTQLGGTGLILRQDEVGLDTREPTEDVARVLSGMVDGVMIRTFAQERVEKLARYSTVPVINGLTDLCHPCQAMADLLTLKEHFGNLRGRTLAFVGDGNNVARSLAVACGRFGMRFVLATPSAYALPPGDVDRIMSQVPQMDFETTTDATEAVRGADCVVTDTWVSMGQEAEKEQRVRDFAGFMVDDKLMSHAPKHAVVLHCLPAYRGYEISESVIESPRSLVFQEAHNRLHVQKGLLAMLLGGR
jgi:ornithine carbamoyltransferase